MTHRLVDRRQRRWTDRFLPGILAGIIVCLLGLTVVSVVAFSASNEVKHAQQIADQAVRGSCDRLQLVRDDANVQANAIYRLLKGVNKGASGAMITKKLRAVDPATRDLMRTLLSSGARAQGLYPKILRDTRYGPPTDCDQAVRHPETYRPPALVPFSAVAECFDPPTRLRPVPPCH